MILDINLLPKKLNDINYFKKVNDGCEIYSYNERLEQRNEVIVVKLPMQIEKDFCIDSKAIEMVRKLNPDQITIDSKSFIIKGQKGKFTSRLLSEQLFDLSQTDLSDEIQIDFVSLVKASGYVSKNEKKPVLCGVRIYDNGDICATDSIKAYFKENDTQKVTEGITLPVNFINLIKTTFNNLKVVKFRYNKNIVMLEESNVKIYSRLIDGNYPNMEKVISNVSFATSVDVDVNELRDRIEIASSVDSGEDKRIIIKLGTNKIEALGDDKYEAEIKFDNGTSYEIKLQLELLDQAIKTIDNPKFKVLYNDTAKIGMIMFVTNEDETEISLILGIK